MSCHATSCRAAVLIVATLGTVILSSATPLGRTTAIWKGGTGDWFMLPTNWFCLPGNYSCGPPSGGDWDVNIGTDTGNGPINGTVFLDMPVTVNSVTLGDGAQGTLNVSGSNTLNANLINVGNLSPYFGTLNISGGGRVSDSIAYIGVLGGSVGYVNVSGAGSQWNTSAFNQFYIGDYGHGTLTIDNGGAVSSNGAIIGFQPGSRGEVTISGTGSQWNDSGAVQIGLDGPDEGGQGSLTLSSGGTGSSNALLIGGAVTVTDPGSKWTTTTGDLVVGEVAARGTLTIANGGIVNNVGNSFVGLSGGTATVTGSGSQWNSAYLAVGYSLGFPQGQGTLTIENGGVVTTTGWTQIADFGGSGSITVEGQGSQLTSAFVDVGNGYGGPGQGTLVVQNGGVVNSGGGSIGTNMGGVGIVTVSGIDSHWAKTRADWPSGEAGKEL